MNETILLLGAGGHARSCVDVIEAAGKYTIAGLVGMPDEVGKKTYGYEVLGSDADLPTLLAECRRAIVTVGQIRTPEIRMALFQRMLELGAEAPVIISPKANVSRHARIGPGTIVMHGAVVNAGATVGSNCILNSQSLVEHDATVGDHCHISTGAILNGEVRVGSGSFVGSGAIVKERVVIGERCVIGMGRFVFSDCEDAKTLLAKSAPAPRAEQAAS